MVYHRTRRGWHRHYKPGRPLVWRYETAWQEQVYQPGDLIPEELHRNKGWLRDRWIARLLDFQDDFPYVFGDTRHPDYVAPAEDSDG